MRRNRRTCLPDRSMMPRTDSPKRSTMPPPSLDMSRRPEPEANTNEMAPLYEKYLQTLMIEHLLKDKGQRRAKDLLIQLASLEKKKDECEEKLHAVKIRIREIETLCEEQEDMEVQIQQVDTFLAENELKLLKVLEEIHSSLESFDKLACKDVAIPETSEDLAALFEVLEQFNQSLNLFGKLIGDKSAPMISMNKDLKAFTNSFMVAEKLLKRMHENLENLQVEVLKKGSASLE